MNKLSIYSLKILRKLYVKTFGNEVFKKPACDQNPDSVSQKIYNTLIDDKPCMIARFGAFELASMVNYLGVKNNKSSYLGYIKGNVQPWWWNKKTINYMHTNAGFFPPTTEKIEQFCELMLQDIPEVDILGSWLAYEDVFKEQLDKALKVNLELLNPFFSKTPWTKAMENKRILVVHPFAETIEKQYEKREVLFENKDILPKFKSLSVLKAVQSLAGIKTNFNDWFDALEYMKGEIDKTDFDICLIGAGAYGFSLAAHVKRTGKKAVHMGGSLQLLFGIRGARWENENYNATYNYAILMNEHWVNPSDKEKPKNAAIVENACYW